MTKPGEMATDHLPSGLLVRTMDDELSPSETAQVESHLSGCEGCKQRFQELRLTSDRVERAVEATTVDESLKQRELLVNRLEAREPVAGRNTRQVLRRFGWGMGLAATLALGVIFAPRKAETAKTAHVSDFAPLQSETFELNGETFVSLPYSNPDLPVNPSHIVRMRVPVSSLADAGVIFESVSAQITAPDRSVLADVLLGMDGQPLGVHVLNSE